MLLIETKTLVYGTISFIINEDRVYLQTPLQIFLLEATEYHWRKRLQRIALMVEMGHIRNYADLFEQTGDVIRLVPVKKEWVR